MVRLTNIQYGGDVPDYLNLFEEYLFWATLQEFTSQLYVHKFFSVNMGSFDFSVSEAANSETIHLEDFEGYLNFDPLEEDWDNDPTIYQDFYCPIESLRGGPHIPWSSNLISLKLLKPLHLNGCLFISCYTYCLPCIYFTNLSLYFLLRHTSNVQWCVSWLKCSIIVIE